MSRLPNILGIVVICLVLAACGYPTSSNRERYVSPSTGVVTPIETDRESCLARCNSDFDRCSDQESTRRNSSYGLNDRAYGLRDMVGATADCRSALTNCLKRCKGR